jgi:SAM-dependent methyltransferase
MPPNIPPHPSKQLIEQSYNLIAPRYLAWTSSTPSPREEYTNKLLSLLSTSPRPKILELGCGAGIPCTQYLAQHATVTANDISSAQLALAAQNAPSAVLIHSDMMSLSFPPNSFDAVVAFYSIIHLPRDEQEVLMERMYGWVKEGGYFLGNLGTMDCEESVRENWLGEKMFWSGWGEAGNRGYVYPPSIYYQIEQELTRELSSMVEGAGWRIVEGRVVEQEEKGEEGREDRMVPFLWVIGRKGNRQD